MASRGPCIGTCAFRMDTFCAAQLAAALALGDGASLLLDLVQRAVCVLTCGRAVAFDARLATSQQGLDSYAHE